MEPPAGALSSSLLTSFLLARGVDDVQSADGDLVIHATHPQPAAQPLAVAAPPTSVAMGAAAALPLSVPMMPAREYVLIMLGAPNTGKTALLTRYAEERFVDEYEPTLESNYTISVHYAGQPVLVRIREIGGGAFSARSTAGVDGYLLLFAVDDRSTFTAIQTMHETLSSLVGNATAVPRVLIGMRSDEVSSAERAVSVEEAQAQAESWRCLYIDCSAKTGANVANAFQSLLRAIDQQNMPPATSVVMHSPKRTRGAERAARSRKSVEMEDARDAGEHVGGGRGGGGMSRTDPRDGSFYAEEYADGGASSPSDSEPRGFCARLFSCFKSRAPPDSLSPTSGFEGSALHSSPDFRHPLLPPMESGDFHFVPDSPFSPPAGGMASPNGHAPHTFPTAAAVAPGSAHGSIADLSNSVQLYGGADGAHGPGTPTPTGMGMPAAGLPAFMYALPPGSGAPLLRSTSAPSSRPREEDALSDTGGTPHMDDATAMAQGVASLHAYMRASGAFAATAPASPARTVNSVRYSDRAASGEDLAGSASSGGVVPPPSAWAFADGGTPGAGGKASAELAMPAIPFGGQPFATPVMLAPPGVLPYWGGSVVAPDNRVFLPMAPASSGMQSALSAGGAHLPPLAPVTPVFVPHGFYGNTGITTPRHMTPIRAAGVASPRLGVAAGGRRTVSTPVHSAAASSL